MFRKFRNALSRYTWDLAIGDYSETIIRTGIIPGNLHVVKNPYPSKWFADPFFLSVDDENCQLLVEEFDSDVKRGRIARLLVDRRDYTIKECKIILELDTHLSFPVIYRVGNEIFVHPENSASGKSYIYRYDMLQDKLVNPILLVDEPLTDAIIRNEKGLYRLYATKITQNAGPLLYSYQSKSLLEPYNKSTDIDFGQRTARMAGAFIENYDGIIRPAQDCRHDYGEGVIFYNGCTVISELRPWGLYEGLHTFNTYQGLFVIDLKRYDYPRTHKLLKRIKTMLR